MTGKLGINADYVQTNRNSTMGDDMAPMTVEQESLMQASVNRGYRLFKSRVADGRAMTMDRVEELAQGHVYLGMDAKKLKLVDRKETETCRCVRRTGCGSGESCEAGFALRVAYRFLPGSRRYV